MIVTLLCYTLNNISEISEIYNNRHVFTLNHLNIPTVDQLKYLGIIISVNNCAPDLKCANYMLMLI